MSIEHDDTPERFGFADLAAFTAQAGDKRGAELLSWAAERFGDGLCIASSLGPEDVALLELLWQQGALGERAGEQSVRVFTLDTGRLHQQTYELMDRLMDRYQMRFDVYFPRAEGVEQMVRERGPNLFYRSIDDRRACCHVRKLEPLSRALAPASAWVTGLRAEQSPTRTMTDAVELDMTHGGLIKLNPLVDWSREQLWDFLRAFDVPTNALHDQGFASIGCAPCTRAIEPGEDERAGRWWWERPDQKECGLHPSRATH